MLNQKILEYVDDVVSRISNSKEFKMKFENDFMRHIIAACEKTSIEEIMTKLGSPKALADKMSRKLIPEIKKELDIVFTVFDKENYKTNEMHDRSFEEIAMTGNYDCNNYNNHCNHHHDSHQRVAGEYMREESNVNIKLLYIPLIQISSGTERIRLPYVDKCFFDY